MSRSDPCKLKRPGPVEEYREFTDPLQPGEVFGFALRAVPDGSLDALMAEKAQQYITDYVVGRNGGKPAPLLPVDGKPVAMTERLCRNIAGLELMEFIPDWNTIADIRWKPPEPEPTFDPTTGEEVAAVPEPLPELQATGYDAPYSFLQWRALSVNAPNVWDMLMEWSVGLIERAKSGVKN